mmetsp:Transcript_14368/g.20010  ORF Transcript_14368/g.20010 Transcript_14368/m.20010 type:complete len:88 (+) Transcript_14368:147-410(+)
MLFSVLSTRAPKPLIARQAVQLFSTSTPPPPRGGAGLLHRLSSFVIGAGVTALATQYYLFMEVREGNKLMLLKQKELETRLANLEKK